VREDTLVKKETRLKDIVKLSASVGIEYGYTNIKFPGQLSSAQYTRVYLRPTVSLFGVPFTLNGMITTETNTHYPLDYFSFGFDANKFVTDFANNAIKDQLETEQRLELNTVELQKVNRSLEKYEREKNAMNKSSIDTSTIKRPLLEGRRKKKAQETAHRIEELEIKKRVLEYDRYKDSVWLIKRKWDVNDNDTLQRFIKKQPYKNVTKTLLAVKSFQVGLCTPHYSSITLSQVPVQGVHTELRFRHWFVSGTAGNRLSVQPFFGSRSAIVPEFKNPTYATRLGVLDRKSGTSVYVSWFNLRNIPGRNNKEKSENTILSAGFESKVIPLILLKGEVAKSFYENTDANIQREQYGFPGSFGNDYNNISFDLNAAAKITSNSELTAAVKKIGTGYYTLGVPFLRNDYVEYTAAWKQYYWYKQLETEFSYMENRDNLSSLKAQTTILRGYGGTLKTHFRARPNLLLMYKPFNSSFSFVQQIIADPAVAPELVTQQFYLLHATLFYNVNVKTIKLNSSVSYNRSNNRNSEASVYTLETYTGTLLFTNDQGRQLNYLVVAYKSNIAANNSIAHDLSYIAGLLRNKIRTTVGGTAQFASDGKQRAGVYSQVTWYLKRLNISARLSSAYLEGNWYAGNQRFENRVNVLIDYRF
jgi:hypothetical protein